MRMYSIFKPEKDQNYVDFVKSEVRLQKAPVKNTQNLRFADPRLYVIQTPKSGQKRVYTHF